MMVALFSLFNMSGGSTSKSLSYTELLTTVEKENVDETRAKKCEFSDENSH